MLRITPCRNTINDRFPVASFVVHVPANRVFEIACATDAALFRREHKSQRTPDNFFTSRWGGLLRAPAGQATYIIPPQQLRRFAGQRRLYYALASYGDVAGTQAEFSVPPGQFEHAPYVALAPDFQGRLLDRSRLHGAAAIDSRYGSAVVPLSWGADGNTPEPSTVPVASVPLEYDDGYSPALWGEAGHRATPTSMHLPVGSTDYPELGLAEESVAGEPNGAEDAPALLLSREAEEYGRRSGGAYGSAMLRQHSAAARDERRAEPYEAPKYGRGFEDAPAIRSRMHHTAAPISTASEEPPGLEDARTLPVATTAYSSASYGNAAVSEPDGAEHPRDLQSHAGISYGTGAGLQPTATIQLVENEAPAPAGVDAEFADLLGRDPEGELTTPAPSLDGEPLTILEKFKIIQPVAALQSGAAGYSAIFADGEFNDPTHPAYQRVHYGLSWGFMQFNQRGGALGQVLAACERRDAVAFAQVFGAERDRLLRVVGAAAEEERLRPVGGMPLWQEPWLARFVEAGRLQSFQAAQNEVAIEGYFDPNIAFASNLGLDSERALCMLYDRCVNMGNLAGRRFVLQSVTPIHDDAALRAALAAAGYSNIQMLQRAHGLVESGTLGPKGHAALLGQLRGMGARAPIAVPTLTEMLDKLVTSAKGRRFEARMSNLRHTAAFSDAPRKAA